MLKSKYNLILMLTFALTLIFCICAHASDKISLYVNGDAVSSDVSPVAVNGRTLVPARSVFEKLGAEVTWIGSRQQIIIRSVKTRIVLNLGSDIAYVNSKSVKLDTEPMVIDGRTLIPVRFVSERLGYNVRWEPKDNSVHIDIPGMEKEEPDIKKISVSKNGNTTVVTIKVTDMVRPEISYATDPMRFIADFPGATLSLSGSKYDVSSKSVKEVRYALHPDYTRVVIESPDDVKYSVSYTSDTMKITVTGTSDDKTQDKEEDKTQRPSQSTPVLSPSDTLVVIDAGHGGDDCGAIGYDTEGKPEVYESEVNLEIALNVKKYLQAEDINVLMTRTRDVALGSNEMEDLLKRSEIANDSGATFFVSIHNNSFTSEEASGTEVLYADLETKLYAGVTSEELARNILKPLAEATGLENRGIKDSPKMVVLKTTTMPSVLIETAFVSNESDRKILMDKSKLDDIGYAIAQGIIKSLKMLK